MTAGAGAGVIVERPARVPIDERIHQAAADGRACVRCGMWVCGRLQTPWRPGEFVAVIDDDEIASWATTRPPNCTDRRGR